MAYSFMHQNYLRSFILRSIVKTNEAEHRSQLEPKWKAVMLIPEVFLLFQPD